MAWTATVKQVDQVGDQVQTLVEFADGTQTLSRSFSFSGTLDDARRAVRDFIVRLDKATLLKSQIIGTIDTNITDSVYVPSAREVYSSKVRKLQAAQRAVALGVLPANTPDVMALQAEVAAGISWEYADLF